MCEAIDSSVTGNNRLAKLYAAANVYYNYTGKATCFDLDDNSDPHDLGGWQWQVNLSHSWSNIIFSISISCVFNFNLIFFQVSKN